MYSGLFHVQYIHVVGVMLYSLLFAVHTRTRTHVRGTATRNQPYRLCEHS